MTEEQIIKWDNLEISSDFIFGQVLKKEDLLKSFAATLLGFDINEIEKLEFQKNIKTGYFKKGIRLDVYFKTDNKVINIEMQVNSETNLIYRCKFYDVNLNIKGQKKGALYKKTDDTYVVFICLFDPFEKDNYKYEFSFYDKEHKLDLNDGRKIMFFNALAYDKVEKNELSSLLKYIAGHKEVETNLVKLLDEEVTHVKENEFLVGEYMKYQADISDATYKGYDTGKTDGIELGKLEIAKELLDILKDDVISEKTGLSLDIIRNLRLEM